MKNIVVLIISMFICLNAFAMPIKEAKKYIDKDVFIVKGDTVTPCGLYGRIVDIVTVRGRTYIVLDTFYGKRELMWFSLENIDYIRERKGYE